MPEPLRLLVVDDEPPARARLKRLLLAMPEVLVVGEAADGRSALTLAESLTPDAMLLDVQMPELGGLDVAASLPEGGPAVIFVTAFEQYALDAFDTAALDYLLKPVDPQRLARAVQRLRQRRPAGTRLLQPPPARLIVSERGEVRVIERAQIVWLQAADNYVEVGTAAGMHLLRRTLEGLLADLGPGFVRIHRSRAVALAAVSGVQSAGKGEARVSLIGGPALGCSRAYRAGLAAALHGMRGG